MIYSHPDCRAADNLFDKQAHKFNGIKNKPNLITHYLNKKHLTIIKLSTCTGDYSDHVIDTHLMHISTFLLSKILTITSANAVDADAMILNYLTSGDILLMNGNNRKILSPDICAIPLRLVFLSSIAEMLSTAIGMLLLGCCWFSMQSKGYMDLYEMCYY